MTWLHGILLGTCAFLYFNGAMKTRCKLSSHLMDTSLKLSCVTACVCDWLKSNANEARFINLQSYLCMFFFRSKNNTVNTKVSNKYVNMSAAAMDIKLWIHYNCPVKRGLRKRRI